MKSLKRRDTSVDRKKNKRDQKTKAKRQRSDRGPSFPVIIPPPPSSPIQVDLKLRKDDLREYLHWQLAQSPSDEDVILDALEKLSAACYSIDQIREWKRTPGWETLRIPPGLGLRLANGVKTFLSSRNKYCTQERTLRQRQRGRNQQWRYPESDNDNADRTYPESENADGKDTPVEGSLENDTLWGLSDVSSSHNQSLAKLQRNRGQSQNRNVERFVTQLI